MCSRRSRVKSSPSIPRSKSTPGLINEDALGRGWLFRIKLADPTELTGLMDEPAYADFLKTLG